MTNFNITPNRRKNFNLTKWTWYPKDVLPMWVADMDFPAPKPILDSLQKLLEHGVLGYELPGKVLYETVAKRMNDLYKWKISHEAVIAVPGVMSGINVAARVFCSDKKGLAVQTPVYNGFHEVKNNASVPQVDIPFIKKVKGNIISYEIDWVTFEKQIKKTKIFLLCNPHNPLGIIFSRRELIRMAEICIKHKVIIVSDEIHSELLLDKNKFTPIAKLSKEIEKNTITLIAASKTFNVPGFFCAFAIIPNKELRTVFEKEVHRLGLHVGSAGLHASKTAFSGVCDSWLKELNRYLTANRNFLVEYVTKNMPNVKTTIPDATYLGWLDFTETGIEKPYEFFLENAKVALSDGNIFGKDGASHLRINFGTSRALLQEGLNRMSKAMKSIK
ncbi:MAG: class I/II aminotransferase [Chloroflexi bacterium OLB14]|nr:MAG: class I/II aminotransferase [Chloroflexi bacterium OLB14]